MRLGEVSGVRGCGAGDCVGRRRGRGGQALLLLLLLLRSLDVAAEARVLSKDERQTSTLPALSLVPSCATIPRRKHKAERIRQRLAVDPPRFPRIRHSILRIVRRQHFRHNHAAVQQSLPYVQRRPIEIRFPPVWDIGAEGTLRACAEGCHSVGGGRREAQGLLRHRCSREGDAEEEAEGWYR